jgi:hypothetical protein
MPSNTVRRATLSLKSSQAVPPSKQHVALREMAFFYPASFYFMVRFVDFILKI